VGGQEGWVGGWVGRRGVGGLLLWREQVVSLQEGGEGVMFPFHRVRGEGEVGRGPLWTAGASWQGRAWCVCGREGRSTPPGVDIAGSLSGRIQAQSNSSTGSSTSHGPQQPGQYCSRALVPGQPNE
jgi:hypothetical protein